MSIARTLADLLDSSGDVKSVNLDNVTTYSKPSSEPISYISGLQSTLDAKTTPSYVDTKVADLVASSPATLDTLNELAAALGDDANHATTMTNLIGAKLPLSGGTLSGNLDVSGNVTADPTGGGVVRVTRTLVSANYLQLEHDGTNGTISSSANNLIVRNNGAERMRISSTGNVGIGVQTPTNRLEIGGGSREVLSINANSHKWLFDARGTYDSNSNALAITYDSSEYMRITSTGKVEMHGDLDVTGNVTVSDKIILNAESTDAATIGTTIDGIDTHVDFYLADDQNSDSWRWRYNHWEATYPEYTAMSLKSSNGVAKLDVSGTVTADGVVLSAVYPKITLNDETGVPRNFSIGTNNETFTIRNETGSSDVLAITNANNVGIGTSSPSTPLEVVGPVNSTYFSGGSDSVANRQLTLSCEAANGNDNATHRLTVPSGFGEFAINVGDSERMRIDSSGNVGIGTSNPSQKLHVTSTGFAYGRFSNSSYTGIDIGQHSGGDVYLNLRDNKAIRFQTNNTERMVITSTGNVGIGTSSPSYKMTIADSYTDGKHIRMENGSEIGMLTLDDSGDIRLWAHGSATKIVTGTGGGSTTATFDSAGNMGLGVAPNGDLLTNTANLQMGVSGGTHLGLHAESGAGARTAMTSNAKKTSTNWASGWEYIHSTSTQATLIGAFGGNIQFKVAPSGTADTAISWTTAMTIGNTGNVGIGTTNPTSTLDVSGTVTADYVDVSSGINIGATTSLIETSGGDSFFKNTDTGADLFLESERRIRFVTAGFERLHIDSSGNVEMGGDLDVSGTIHASEFISGGRTLDMFSLDSGKFYPVMIEGGTSSKFNNFKLTKSYGSDNPSGMLGGVVLDMDIFGYTWGGNPLLNIVNISASTYRCMLGAVTNRGYYKPVIWLRGGYRYQYVTDRNLSLTVKTVASNGMYSVGSQYDYWLGPLTDADMQAKSGYLGTQHHYTPINRTGSCNNWYS